MQITVCRKKQLLAVILIAQLLLTLYVAGRKQEFNIDEIYDYVLSNSYHADKISNEEGLFGHWVSGSHLDSFITVQEGEGFAYKTVYLNNSTDCHPPMHYWVLHTVCSLFPNRFSKWFGIAVNLLFMLIAGIFIFLISDQLIESPVLKFLPLILYGFSSFAVDNAMFIRMYQMLTMLAAILTYLHCLLFEKGVSLKRLVPAWLIIYLGAMTHYYFLVFSFFGAALFSLYLLFKKQIRNMLLYGLGACAAVAAMLLSYPYAISQATGSSTNNVGNEVAQSILDFRLWISQCIDRARMILNSISYIPLLSRVIAAVSAAALIALLLRALWKREKIRIPPGAVWTGLTAALTFLSVTFIGGHYVYARYFYYVIPLFYLTLIALFDRLSAGCRRLQIAALIGFTVFALANAAYGAKTDGCMYLYRDNYQNDLKLEAYSHEKLLIVLDEVQPIVPTGNLTKIREFDSFYIDTKDNIERTGEFGRCLEENGTFVVFVTAKDGWTDGFDAEELIPELSGEAEVEYSEITSGGSGEYYLVKSAEEKK